ncbi:O-succinylbenzoic acid--CoA ligase [Polaribacter sp. ALD11]|uniref:AMP-binding protein n=1 Tax=Polaribacter sp. ALD11 TaxID=2058137 RepID=UPI000C305629|nr:AMP-binding protein [Polaribacter sp. ALD11]AUC86535.1 O-succinylbenzoic acid--CoA ligase [Polaribacter sp. ALD11]
MNINFHKDFKLNEVSFATVDELLVYTANFSEDVQHFLGDWFSEKEFVVVQTSGSTGIPKLIKLQKKQMQNSAIATGNYFNLKEKTTAFLCLPVEYIAGKMMLVRAITLGWHLDIVAPTSSPLKENSTAYDFSAMVPLQVENSLEKLHQIKKLIVGGGVVSNNLQEKLQPISTEVFATYGMTETITHIAIKKLNHFTSLRGELMKQCLPKEFYQTLPGVIIYKDERNCLVIDAQKVSQEIIFTNDVVNLISDTQFEWLGRFDNVINSGGIKLHPEKIEEKLSRIIEQRFFVVGIPDEKLGKKLILVIELDSFKISKFERLLAVELNNLVGLSKFEVPKKIYFIDAFIETETKKIQRKKTLDLIKF